MGSGGEEEPMTEPTMAAAGHGRTELARVMGPKLLLLFIVGAALSYVARWLHVAPPILLLLGGVALGFLLDAMFTLPPIELEPVAVVEEPIVEDEPEEVELTPEEITWQPAEPVDGAPAEKAAEEVSEEVR